LAIATWPFNPLKRAKPLLPEGPWNKSLSAVLKKPVYIHKKGGSIDPPFFYALLFGWLAPSRSLPWLRVYSKLVRRQFECSSKFIRIHSNYLRTSFELPSNYLRTNPRFN
jgi:hypothetical protein